MGVATIQARTTLQMRVDPESMIFGYVLNTKTDSTYGGKVIQILSTTITDLEVKAVAGAGRRDYLIQVATFFKDMMTWQRDSQEPGTFSYPPRNYNLHVYAAALQFNEATENVSFPYTMKFKVLDDAGQLSGEIAQAEIDKLKDGVGYTRNEYNDPSMNAKPVVPAYDPNGGEQPGGGAGGGAGGGGAGGLPGPGAP